MLNSTELELLYTKKTSMTSAQAIEYLQECGIPIGGVKQYENALQKIEDTAHDRMNQIGINFADHHNDHIDTLFLVEHELWKQYKSKKQVIRLIKTENGQEAVTINIEQDPVDKTKILREIRELQPYISAYRADARGVLENTQSAFDENSIGTYLRKQDEKSSNTIPAD